MASLTHARHSLVAPTVSNSSTVPGNNPLKHILVQTLKLYIKDYTVDFIVSNVYWKVGILAFKFSAFDLKRVKANILNNLIIQLKSLICYLYNI